MNPTGHTIATFPIKTNSQASMGSILIELGKLIPSDMELVLNMQKQHGLRFGEAARRLGLVSEADVQLALARQFDYPCLQPGQVKYSEELVAAFRPFSAQAEMLRTVRIQLMQQWFDTGHKVLAVASANRGEGASYFAANLAVVFSQLGKHVLLIEANLRNPRQHHIFDLAGRQGLSDILAGRAGMETFSKVEAFPSLSILPAGTLPPNPQELISRVSFEELVASLASRFDVIIVDTPAFAVGGDALAITSKVGGVLLVCRNNKTRMNEINAVQRQLSRAGTRIVGSVLLDF